MKIRHFLLAALCLPFVEFWFFGMVSNKLGVLPSLLLLVLLSFSGFALLKAEGKRFLAALKNNETLSFSGEEARESVRIGLGGALLAMPGFLSDIVALYFLLPSLKRLISGEYKPSSSHKDIIDLAPEQYHETLEKPTASPAQNS